MRTVKQCHTIIILSQSRMCEICQKLLVIHLQQANQIHVLYPPPKCTLCLDSYTGNYKGLYKAQVIAEVKINKSRRARSQWKYLSASLIDHFHFPRFPQLNSYNHSCNKLQSQPQLQLNNIYIKAAVLSPRPNAGSVPLQNTLISASSTTDIITLLAIFIY